MKSIEELIGPNQPYVIETVGTTTARTAEKLMKGLSEDNLQKLIYAILGLYLTGKAIRLNLSRGVAITTEEQVAGFSPAMLATMSYVAPPEGREEPAAVIQKTIDAAIEFKFVGKFGRMLMLTGKGLQALEAVMKKENMYN